MNELTTTSQDVEAPRSVLEFLDTLTASKYFYREAAGAYLCEVIDSELLDDKAKLLEFIEDNKCEAVEDISAELVERMISDRADTLHSSALYILKLFLSTVPKTEVEALQDGAVADIWYDASYHGDTSAAAVIKNTQDAMSIIADFLTK
ncbi:HEAT repeat domain-containing protein [Vibrio crassostreae]|nr:HEAT repeat domain-containing protein [Vibrio crassostreae]CAK3043617.1 HEAT repeat domain-containing protein [Vibrio crassostreae]CAK3587094.1 HEAT repeat domain-containing protein [Vibrio crassostreae]CAK3984001.1 HEAT repeat domain-containing protein [Vibrio crassostreae]